MSKQQGKPSVDEIKKLPRWAKVAFAARCARRVHPLFAHCHLAARADFLRKIDQAIEVSENVAACTHSGADFSSAAAAARAAGETASAANCVAAARAAAAAAHAASAAYLADEVGFAAAAVTASPYVDIALDTSLAAHTAFAAVHDASGRDTARLVAKAIRGDYDLLLERARIEQWNDSTPAPPTVFGPLWPEGTPPGWPTETPPIPKDEPASTVSPAASADPDIRLVLTATVHGDIDVDTVTEDLLKLYKAFNAYHIARGGTGLKLEDFRRWIRSAVGAEV